MILILIFKYKKKHALVITKITFLKNQLKKMNFLKNYLRTTS